jgi:hypothetical protein
VTRKPAANGTENSEIELSVPEGISAPAEAEAEHQGDNPEPDPDVFPREYVAELRAENAEHRTKATEAANRAEELSRQLWLERVTGLGLLADPTDLPYNAEIVSDPAGIRAAAEELLAAKPHLRTRRITGRAGAGEGSPTEPVSLSAMLRANA